MDLFKSKIAEGLRLLRVEKGYSQEYLAEVMGKTDYTGYGRIEQGRTELKFEDAYKLARLYDIPMEHIFDPDLRHQSNTMSDVATPAYGRKNMVQVTVFLDGTLDGLKKQCEMLESFNQVLAQKLV